MKLKVLIKTSITTYYEGKPIASTGEVWGDVLQQLPCGGIEVKLQLAESSRVVRPEDVIRSDC